jgi:hypothetical protein
MSKRFLFVGLGLAALVILLVSLSLLRPPAQQATVSEKKETDPQARTEEAQEAQPAKEEGATSAGTKAPEQKPAAKEAGKDLPEELKSAVFNPGRAQTVPPNATPQAASVAEALKQKNHPERLSALIAPKPFDRAAFERDPESYLKTIEPGRVFQCAQPGENVPVLRAEGSRDFRIEQGGSVKLAVKGAPRSPVTFNSFDMGTFSESKLNTVTVRADEQGVASVTFVATPGAINVANILAASPLASGQVKFAIEIMAKR